jgi:UTP--glucose-1-phosphate uridylyltransferase
MRIRKAVITAAGPDQRELPLQRLVDRDGTRKSALRLVLDEAARAGVQEIAVVAHPDDAAVYAKAAGDPGPRVRFLDQKEPRGYAAALRLAREFVGDEPFLHLVGDHLFVARGEAGPAQELVAAVTSDEAALCAVQPTRESQLRLYGVIGGARVHGREHQFTVDAVLEKPTPTEAEQKLFVPGLRAGSYLGFFGIHVLPASIFALLDEAIAEAGDPRRASLSGALARLAARSRCFALEVDAARFNLGEKYGLLVAQLALALSGSDRDEVLLQLTEVLLARDGARAREGAAREGVARESVEGPGAPRA